jgi:hypothetical protein
MKYHINIVTLLVLLPLISLTQQRDVEATISAEVFKHTEHFYNDSIKITLTLKNNTINDFKIRMQHDYFALFISEEKYSYNHCFELYPAGNVLTRYSDERSEDSFVTIPAGGEYSDSKYFRMGWLCRNAPSRGEWNFSISYNRMITPEDNYYHLKSYYSDKPEKVFVEDAWIGEIESNKVKIKLR